MLVYKIDKLSYQNHAQHIRDMHVVLKEIAPTLQTLSEQVRRLQNSASTPALNKFQARLLNDINQAMGLTSTISEDATKLVEVADQVVKHTVALEDFVASSLTGSAADTTQKMAATKG